MDTTQYYCYLITQKPINYNGLLLYQPSFEEIMNYGIDYYNQIMMIYSLTLECFTELPDKENIDIFNDFILKDKSLLRCLTESLYILTKADEILLDEENKVIHLKFLNDTDEIWHTINSSNYSEFSDIVLKINAMSKAVVEKPPENMSKKQRDIWEKLQEGRRNDAKKNAVHIYDVLNICEFCGCHISIEEIQKWSLWRIMNCYKARIGIKSYDDNLQIALVSGDGKSISGNNHWYQQLMIRE